MELVDFCALHPGECLFGGGTGGKLVDTGLSRVHDGRVYIAETYAREIGETAGLPSVQALDGAMEQLAVADQTIERLESEVAAMKGALEEAESMRIAIAFTLERGVVQDAKTGKVRLRTQPGQKRIDLSRSLWQPYIETVETPSETAA